MVGFGNTQDPKRPISGPLSEKITIESFTKQSSINELLTLSESTQQMIVEHMNPDKFAENVLQLDDYTLSQFLALKEDKKVAAVEGITMGNIKRASLVFDHATDKLIKQVRDSAGNIDHIPDMKYIEEMLQHVILACPQNREALLAQSLIKQIRNEKSKFTKAFQTGNTCQKTIYYSACMIVIFTAIKEHIVYTDKIESVNQNKIVMIKNGHYVENKENIDYLTMNALLVEYRPSISRPLKENFGFIKGTFAALGISWAVVKFAPSIQTMINKITDWLATSSADIKNSITGAHLPETVTGFIAIGSTLIAVSYILYKIMGSIFKDLNDYVEDYKFIDELSRRSKLGGDQMVGEVIDRMSSKSKEVNNILNLHNRNTAEYMKELIGDEALLKRSNVIPQKDQQMDYRHMPDVPERMQTQQVSHGTAQPIKQQEQPKQNVTTAAGANSFI